MSGRMREWWTCEYLSQRETFTLWIILHDICRLVTASSLLWQKGGSTYKSLQHCNDRNIAIPPCIQPPSLIWGYISVTHYIKRHPDGCLSFNGLEDVRWSFRGDDGLEQLSRTEAIRYFNRLCPPSVTGSRVQRPKCGDSSDFRGLQC